MSYHPRTRCNPTTGASEWAAAHGPCQAAAELMTPEELFHYVSKKEN